MENVIHADHSIRTLSLGMSRGQLHIPRTLLDGVRACGGNRGGPIASSATRRIYCEWAAARQRGSELEGAEPAVALGGIGAIVSFDETLIRLLALIAVTT